MFSSNENIKTMRQKIDQIDKAIIKKIAERMRASRAIGVLKKKHELPIRDRKREQKTNAVRGRLAHALELDKKLISKIFNAITNESRKAQK